MKSLALVGTCFPYLTIGRQNAHPGRSLRQVRGACFSKHSRHDSTLGKPTNACAMLSWRRVSSAALAHRDVVWQPCREGEMATFVLVHGGWDGGWAWRAIANDLRAAGHEVFTPTMTGSGERVHLASPAIDLSTHVTDIANVLRYEDLYDVILVGSSYGGIVITGVAEVVPERLRQLVYLDAFVPQDGQSTS